jgi:hypothetical protein
VTAAALAAAGGGLAASIDVGALQDALRRQGAILEVARPQPVAG